MSAIAGVPKEKLRQITLEVERARKIQRAHWEVCKILEPLDSQSRLTVLRNTAEVMGLSTLVSDGSKTPTRAR
jgi:hypothetical protein